jgi:hypothetical protein
MAIVEFKDLCLDANDPSRLGTFWATVLDRRWKPDDDGAGVLTGSTAQHTVWINRVPEAKIVKHRVHLDVYARSLHELEALGCAVVLQEGEGRRWTVMTDPEGGEFCAFLRPDPGTERLHGLAVDSRDPGAQARWWGQILGVEVIDDERGFSTLVDVPGMPIRTMDFLPVPEAKTVKNRIHWDVTASDLEPLVDAGATVLQPAGEDRTWHVLADPEGNEFCVFINNQHRG